MSDKAIFCFTVDDIGYDGYSTEKHLTKIFELFEEVDVKATFFVVPIVEGKRFDKRSGYIRLMNEALAAGHELAQHGLTHDRFEIGIPPQMVLDLPHEGPTREYLRKNRTLIDASHSVEKIRKILSTGREILENAIGKKIVGFRSPALQTCANMFTALEAEEYEYDSSVHMQKAGWDIINEVYSGPEKIDRAVFDEIRDSRTHLEIPLTAEYTWYLNRARRGSAYTLALHDFDACAEAGIPFVNVSHVSPIQEGDDGNIGFDFYRDLIAQIRKKRFDTRFATLSETSKIWRKKWR